MKNVLFLIGLLFIVENLTADVLKVTNTADTGTGSLRSLIELSTDGDSIVFDKSLNGQTINVLSEITITKSIAIDGKDISITLSGRQLNCVFYINNSISNVRFYNLIFTNAPSSSIRNGSIIYTNLCASIAISNCIFQNNNKGGSIITTSLYGTKSYFNNCKFINNSSTSITANNLSIQNTEFNNTGVVNVKNGNSNFSDCLFINGGKAIDIQTDNTFYISRCTFQNNTITTTTENSTLIYGYTQANIEDCIFRDNIGGCFKYKHLIDGSNHTVNISRCLFADNSKRCVTFGGVDISGSYSDRKNTLKVKDSQFINNINGGAISASKFVIIEDCTFKKNSSDDTGGAIIGTADLSRDFIVNRCTFDNNTAINRGGAICCSLAEIENCTFLNNSSVKGGAIANRNDNVQFGAKQVRFCTFYNNVAEFGGAVYDFSKLAGNLFSKNYTIPDNLLNDVHGGALISEGYNVYSADQSSFFNKSNDVRYNNNEPILLTLNNYGGKTETLPINTSIPGWESIIRRVSKNIIPRTNDQRGYSVTSTFSCAGSLEVREGEVFYSNIESEEFKMLNVYPNPVSTLLKIDFGDEYNSNVLIVFNSIGHIVYKNYVYEKEINLNVENYNAGIYFIHLLNNTGTTFKYAKFIKN